MESEGLLNLELELALTSNGERGLARVRVRASTRWCQKETQGWLKVQRGEKKQPHVHSTCCGEKCIVYPSAWEATVEKILSAVRRTYAFQPEPQAGM